MSAPLAAVLKDVARRVFVVIIALIFLLFIFLLFIILSVCEHVLRNARGDIYGG